MLKTYLVALAVTFALLLSCSDDEPPFPEGEDTPASVEVSASINGGSGCVAVDAALLAAIADGLTIDGGGSLRNGQAVKSADFENVYMIAADLQGPGLDGVADIGVWSSNSLDSGGGIILAVDSIAQEFSSWPAGDTTSFNVTSSAHGVAEARACAGG